MAVSKDLNELPVSWQHYYVLAACEIRSRKFYFKMIMLIAAIRKRTSSSYLNHKIVWFTVLY